MLADERIARLGIMDDADRPRVLPVTFALHGGRLYTAVDQKPKRPGREPARVRFLRRRPDAALTVDRYEDDWEQLAWVQVLCAVDVIEPADDRAGLGALCEKYEPYRQAPPPGPLLRLVPGRALCWRAAEARE
jgi:PPOX class probable F420-dependent enzyme